MGQKPVLGKGLASLFPGMQPTHTHVPSGAPSEAPSGAVSAGPGMPAFEPANRDRHPGISLALVDEIQVNPYQPRREFNQEALEELSRSIQTSGIIQPIVVRKTAAGAYQLIAGERRLRAAKLAGLKQVPIVIRRSTDREALELALIENIQRQDLNCVDEALAYFQLMQDFSLTQEEVAQRVGKERTTVANHLRLLRLPEAIIDDLKRQILTLGHAKAILGLEDNEARLRARAEIVEKHLSVREAEALVDRLKAAGITGESTLAGEGRTNKTPLQTRLLNLAQELTRHWSAKVEIKGSERAGRISIHYGSREELDRLLEAMHNR